MSGSAILRVENITKRFGGVMALDNVSFSVESGTVVGIIGPNGSGKTTLLNVICGITKPDNGSIFFGGNEITGKKPHDVAKMNIGRTFQSLRVFRDLTVEQNLLIAGESDRKPSSLGMDGVLKFIGLEEKKNSLAKSMSYGQQKLLAFGMLLMRDVSLFLLDEIAAGVYPEITQKIAEMIRTLQSRGKTFIVIEHNIPFIASLCNWIVFLDAGKKITEGTPKEIINDPRVVQAYIGKT